MQAVTNAMPATAGVLIQFPLYGAMAAILTTAKNASGVSVADQLAHAFVSLTSHDTFPIAMGIYSAVLGLFVPSGGGILLLLPGGNLLCCRRHPQLGCRIPTIRDNPPSVCGEGRRHHGQSF